jgi:NitT/TauT family transport system substrate-binding protein
VRKAFIAVICVLLAACSPAKHAHDPAGKLTTIRFALDWKAQAELGGFYQAFATGEYAKRGLDVHIIQGGPGVNVPQLLAAGSADMGVGSSSFIALNLAQQNVPVRAVAAIMQKDPQVLIAHPDQGIKSIADMKDHPILLSDASVTGFWLWLKAKYGFTDNQVGAYTGSSATFLSDNRYVQEGYVTSEPFTIEREGHFKPEVFLLADEGYPGYAALILAPDTMIKAKPEAVRAFLEATAAGWNSYLNGDATPGDALIIQDNPEKTPAILAEARAALKAHGLVQSGDAAKGEIGAMTDARWANFFQVVSAAGAYPATLDYHKAYTLQFLGPKPQAPAPK